MAFGREPLEPGLYFVATPIGNARDITLRALDVLATADLLAAEDTRTLRRLMEIHAITAAGRPILAYHDHNGAAQRPRLLAALRAGRSVACVSEAGTPLVSDPGFALARAAIAAGIALRSVPGPSALLAALTVAGLPTDRFFFAGFPPAGAGARRSWIAELARVPGTLVLFESAKRVRRLLGELDDTLGSEREAAMCRELTKRFEETRRGTLAQLAASCETDPPRGEVVIVIDRAQAAAASEDALRAALRLALAETSLRDAVARVSDATGAPRRQIYRLALDMEEGK